MNWLPMARLLAHQVVRPESRWHTAVATTPRHLLVTRWWENQDDGTWILRTEGEDEEAWLRAIYSDRTLTTQVGTLHAERASAGAVVEGVPTSSSTLPSLVVRMYRHAMVADDSRMLVTTGTGYGTALACARLGDDQVTSIDIDEHLVVIAGDRLRLIGHRPHMQQCDITGPLPDRYDRIVSTVSVRPIPKSWLQALRPGGRLVTTIAGTGLILTADKQPDGGATGRIEWDRAGFMRTRHTPDYERPDENIWKDAGDGEGDDISTSRYPLLYPEDAWDVMSMLELKLPGIIYRRHEDPDTKNRTVWLLHPDGSWARATAAGFLDSPTVRQAGPRRLWDELERIRHRLNRDGSLPVYGAHVSIDPDGTTRLSRGKWAITL